VPTDGGAGPVVDGAGVRFELADPQRRLGAVRLVQELGLDSCLDFERGAGTWTLRLPRPAVDRMEYLFEVHDHNGHRQTVTDPGNALRAAGAFGDKSVVEFAEYRAPTWLTAERGAEHVEPFTLDCDCLDAPIAGTLWWPDVLRSHPAKGRRCSSCTTGPSSRSTHAVHAVSRRDERGGRSRRSGRCCSRPSTATRLVLRVCRLRGRSVR
jgi:hypothetical protein